MRFNRIASSRSNVSVNRHAVGCNIRNGTMRGSEPNLHLWPHRVHSISQSRRRLYVEVWRRGLPPLLQTSTPPKNTYKGCENRRRFKDPFLASLRDATFSRVQPGISKTQSLATFFDASGVRRLPTEAKLQSPVGDRRLQDMTNIFEESDIQQQCGGNSEQLFECDSLKQRTRAKGCRQYASAGDIFW